MPSGLDHIDTQRVARLRTATTFDEVCRILGISPNSPEAWAAWLVWEAWKGGK